MREKYGLPAPADHCARAQLEAMDKAKLLYVVQPCPTLNKLEVNSIRG